MTAQYRPYRDEDGLDGLDNDQLAWADHEPGTIQIYEKTTEDLPFQTNRRFLIGTIGLSLISCMIGFLIGYFGHSNHSSCVPNLSVALHSVRDENPLIRNKILEQINEDEIKLIVRHFSSQPRIAGTKFDLEIARKIHEVLNTNGCDKVETKNYTVLLSVPDQQNPNYIELIDYNNNQRTLYSSKNEEKDPSSYSYCAYSPAADITGDVIFVNYGSLSDYDKLRHDFNVTSFHGKIVIAKQFHLSADEQMNYAQQVGAAGLLLYPDPQDFNPKSNEQFGSTNWIPKDTIRRDSLIWNGLGDPLTPGYPATSYAYRLPISSISLPQIPVQPISYLSANRILSLLSQGAKSSINDQSWAGQSFDQTYKLGLGLNGTNFKLRLKINNKLVNQTIYNVIGYIKGRVEPDRYVLIGNHRDSFVYGAIDSASGAGALLELSRVFGQLKKSGWRPRRTIMFCSWGAEEFNLIGSTEWIEEHMKILHSRAVAYINSDILVTGNGSINVAASPLLYHAIFNATKEVPNPNKEEDEKTIYDRWVINNPLMRNSSEMVVPVGNPFEDDEYDNNESFNSRRREHFKLEMNEPGVLLKNYMDSALQEVRPKVRPLDMRSVYAPFFTLAGIPVVEVTYTHLNIHKSSNDNQASNLAFPLVHTQYDTFDLIERQIDPDFKYHKAITQVLGEIIRDLADSLFLPFNLLDYAQVLRDFYLNLQMHAEPSLKKQGINFDFLDSAVKNFTTAAIKFHKSQDNIDFRDPMAIRCLNDQLMLIERAFLDQNGLPRNVIKRHIIMSPSETANSVLNVESFPGLMDEFSMFKEQQLNKSNWSWDVIKAHFSILIFTIQSAAETISDVCNLKSAN